MKKISGTELLISLNWDGEDLNLELKFLKVENVTDFSIILLIS